LLNQLLTIGILERLLLLGWLRDDFDAFAVENADVVSVAVEHFHREHKVLALVRVGDEKRLGRAVLLAVEVELLHVLVRVADADERAQLRALLGLAVLQHLLLKSAHTNSAPQNTNKKINCQ